MKNNKMTSKTVIFDISGMLAAKVVMSFEEGDFNDEQVEFLARLHFAAQQSDRFFERADIIDNTSTSDVEIYGKRFAFTKFRDVLVDEKEMRVLSSFMVINLEDGKFNPLGIVEVSSRVDGLYDPFQGHFLSQYEGIRPCTNRDLAEFLVLIPRICQYEMTSRNNMLTWDIVIRKEDGSTATFDDLTDEELTAIIREMCAGNYEEITA